METSFTHWPKRPFHMLNTKQLESPVDINNFPFVFKISCWPHNSADVNKNKLIQLQALLIIFFRAAQHFHNHINICHNFWLRKIWIFRSIYLSFYCLIKLPMLFVKNIKLKKLILVKYSRNNCLISSNTESTWKVTVVLCSEKL